MSAPSSAPARRLRRFLFGVALVLSLLEGGFRLFEAEIAASANRLSTKAALLGKQGRVDALFFGTSRLWDGISPRIFASAFPGARAFNLAVTSSNIADLEELAARFASRPGLRLAVIELDEQQLSPPPRAYEPVSRIESIAARCSRLIAHRAALRGESLERLPQLLFYAGKMDGSEVHLLEQIDALLGRAAPSSLLTDENALRPVLVAPGAPLADAALERLLSAARLFRDVGVTAAFVVPPVRALNEREPRMREKRAAVAREFPVLDFELAPIPPALWRDGSHLNAQGRALFSRVLAREVARLGLLGRGIAGREN